MASLLDPISVKGLTLKNRIIMPPMASEAALEDGSITDRHFSYYVPRGKGGVALIIQEHAYVALSGRRSKAQIGIHDDAKVQGLAKLVDAVHQAGALIVAQISHAGGATDSSTTGGLGPVAPSAIMHPIGTEVPRELTEQEIHGLRQAFADAALRSKRAGYDGVEIHGAHGYLLSQFLSPITNRRTDRYGGDLRGRATFPLEVVRAVREAVGPGYLVMYRLGAQDQFPPPLPPAAAIQDGLTLDEGVEFARWLEAEGVDIIDVSGGLCGSRPQGQPPEGYFLPLQEAVKRVVAVPVVATGGIRTPQFADSLVREAKADLVGVGRVLLADPEWPNKAAAMLKS